MTTKKKKKKKTHKSYYVVNVCYPIDQYPEYDDRLIATVGRDCDGSGAGFGERDLDWCAPTLPAAINIFKKLSRCKYVSELSLRKEYG